MRKFILLILFPFLIISGLAIILIPIMERDAGYVLIAVGGKVIEMRFWMACLVLLVSLFVLWLIASILRGTFKLTLKTLQWWPAHTQKLLLVRQERAMAALWEGNDREAHRNFVKIVKTKGQKENVLSLVNAANLSTELTLFDEADEYLAQAEQLDDKEHEVTVLMSRATLLQKQQKIEPAISLASQALEIHSTHSGALKMLLGIHQQKKDWQALNSLLPKLKKAQCLNPDALDALEDEIYLGLFAQAQNTNELESVWRDVPRSHKKNINLMRFYAAQLLSLGDDEHAESWLKKAIKQHFDEGLISLYGQVNVPDVQMQMKAIDKWQAQHPDNAALYLAKGQVAERSEQYDIAKEAYQKSLAITPSSMGYSQLANLLARLGEHEASNTIFQQGSAFSVPKDQTLSLQSNLIS